MPSDNCKVVHVGPASDGAETPAPVIYIQLTDEAGSFTNYWFYAADNSKKEMLATAMTAISLKASVAVSAVAPNPNNSPYTQINRLYLAAP